MTDTQEIDDITQAMRRGDILFAFDEGHDPEERLENALLWKSLKDRPGDRIVPQKHAGDMGGCRYLFGRYDTFRLGMHSGVLAHPVHPRQWDERYFDLPSFLANAGRSFDVVPYAGAEASVAAIHASGRDAFVKAAVQKRLALHVPLGTTFAEAMGDLAYSFCDADIDMVVQPYVDMRFEYRIFVIGGQPVTGAATIPNGTPVDYTGSGPTKGFDAGMQERRGSRRIDGWPAANRLVDYVSFARRIAQDLITDGAPTSFVLDLCTIDGETRIVEVNPFHLGRAGLYACNLDRLVTAVLTDLNIMAD